MLNKYVVEVETEDGHASYVTVKIASAKCAGATLTVIFDNGMFDFHTFRNATRAAEAYTKIAVALRAVA